MHALHQRGRSRRLALDCERLEDRYVPASLIIPGGPGTGNSGNTYDLNRTITINGTKFNDLITMDEQDSILRVSHKSFGPGASEETQLYLIYKGTRIVVHAGDGNDEVRNNTSLPSVLYGEDGFDMLFGGSAGDELRTGNNDAEEVIPLVPSVGPHNDFAYGRGGNDMLIGDNGADQLFGGEGEDQLYGYGNKDFLNGGNHNDMLYGGNGDDQLFGEEGTDTLNGEAGSDTLIGGNGVDYFYGGTERDNIVASGDNAIDEIESGPGADAISPDWHLVAGTSLKVIDDHINDPSTDDTILF